MWKKYRDRSGFVCIPDHVAHMLTFSSIDMSRFTHVFDMLDDKGEYRIDDATKVCAVV
jgi:hypothetical protein